MSSVFSSHANSNSDRNPSSPLDFLLPPPLQGRELIIGQLNAEALEALVPEITTNWDSAEFIIQAVKENPELGKQLLPQIRDILPDDSWQKAKLLGLCGEEEDLRRAINLIASNFHHDATYAAMGMLSRGVGKNLQNEFEESLLNALDNDVLSNSSEVKGVDELYRHNALERVAGDRWEVVEKAWEAKLISANGLVRLASYPHLPESIRSRALLLFLGREKTEAEINSIVPILNNMATPTESRKLCLLFLAVMDELPTESIKEDVKNGLELGCLSPLERAFKSLLRRA